MTFHAVSFLSLLGAASCLVACGCRRDPVDRAMRALTANNAALAESLLAARADAEPDNSSLHANLAIARLKLGQFDAALTGFRRVADQVPDDARPLEFMATIAAADGRWRMSQELLFEAARRDPQSPRIQTALAVAELKTAGAAIAAQRLTRTLSVAPNYSPAVFNLAILQQDYLNNPAEAARLFDRYLAIATDAEHLGIARQALAQLRSAPPRPGDAPSAPPPGTAARRPQAAAQAYNQGVRHHTAGELDKAVDAYQRAIEADPSSPNAHYNLGLIHRTRKQLDAACQAFQRTLDLQPSHTDARYMMAVTLRDQGHTGAAIDQLETLVARNPDHAQSHHALGLLYKDTPATRELAKRAFEKYLELAPDGAHAKTARNWLNYRDR